MDGFDLLAEMTTTFSATVTAAERDESLHLLESFKVRTDGAVPTVRYSRQLVVHMPKFAQVGLDMKDYIDAG